MRSLKVCFSKHEGSSRLNAIIRQTDLRCMLKGEDYRALEMFFLFFFESLNTSIVHDDEDPLLNIHIQYTKLANPAMSDNHSKGCCSADVAEIRSSVHYFKK